MLVSSSLLLDYRFGIDIGDIFYDYSGNNNHAINQQKGNLQKFLKTDRGIYTLDKSSSLEASNKLPQSNTFSIKAKRVLSNLSSWVEAMTLDRYGH